MMPVPTTTRSRRRAGRQGVGSSAGIGRTAVAREPRLRLLLRIVGLVVGSVFFFPVSCTGSMVGLMSVAWPWNHHDLAAGQKVPHGFPVMLSAPDGAVRGVVLDTLADEIARLPGSTPLLQKPQGDLEDEGNDLYRWKVEAATPAEQTIALAMVDDDIDWNVRYVARADGVRPLEARFTTPGDVFLWFPVSLLLAFAVGWLGRRLARRNAPPAPVPAPA